MATSRNWWGTTLKGADPFGDILAGTGSLFKAVAVDGTYANNGIEAYGVVQSVANSGENVTVAWLGEMKYTAGIAIGAGIRLSVSTSGYLITPNSGDFIVGRNTENSVASGAVGRGLLNFAAPHMFQNSDAESNLFDFTVVGSFLSAAAALGKGVHSNSGDFALEEGGRADGVLITGATSGQTAVMQVAGIAPVCAGDVVAQGVSLTITDSGYWEPAGVNDNIWGRSLEASAAGNSGSLFTAMISFANPQISAVVSDAIVD